MLEPGKCRDVQSGGHVLRVAVALLVGLLVTGVASAGPCPKPCKKELRSQLETCKKACPERKAGRTCRIACKKKRAADVRTCRAAAAPTPPLCGATPAVTPSTTTTNPPAASSTTSTTVPTTTTTTLCIPETCTQADAECGAIDDGCGRSAPCGDCPAEAPVCIAGECHDGCALQPDGTACNGDANLCTVEKCASGACVPDTIVVCLGPAPCYTAVACNPATAACESSGYAGDATACGSFGIPIGLCANGACAAGADCVIASVPYEAGDLIQGFGGCVSCQPEVSQTSPTPLTGPPCPGGVCNDGACLGDVCSIGGAIHQAGTPMPANPCRSCQPNVDREAWSPVADGPACPGGVCVGGSCDASSCVIGGVVYANGATNPGNWCQRCDVTSSRTSWTNLPNNSACGFGCLFGFCSLGFGGCAIVGASACAPTDCGNAFCDATTGACKVVPANVGGPCSGVTTNPCLSSQGTCDASGNCVLAPLTAQPCVPGNHGRVCLSTTEGTCDAAGGCAPKVLPDGTVCLPPGGDSCALYQCGNAVSGSPGCGTVYNDGKPQQTICPPAPAGCSAGQCNPSTLQCTYGPDPSGTRSCSSSSQCCPGQVCRAPLSCVGIICLERYCFDLGSPN